MHTTSARKLIRSATKNIWEALFWWPQVFYTEWEQKSNKYRPEKGTWLTTLGVITYRQKIHIAGFSVSLQPKPTELKVKTVTYSI